MAEGVSPSEALLAAATLAGGGAWLPFSKKFRERRRRRRAVRKWLYGEAGVEGISSEVLSAPVQFVEMQRDIKELKELTRMSIKTLRQLEHSITGDASPYRNRRSDDRSVDE